MLAELKKEVRKRVHDAIAEKQSADIAGVRLTIISQPNGVVVSTCGDVIRVDDSDRMAESTVFSLVFSQIKADYRESGPEAALTQLKGE
jgi:hypothetical protein